MNSATYGGGGIYPDVVPHLTIGDRPAGGATIWRMGSADTGLPRSIGAPATRALTAAGYTDVRQLAGVPASELRKLHGVGPKALRLLQEELQRQGLSLA